ncbi:DEAD/DEAH box helicase [bacterium]|nr:DEAD/DEAH box helicase [bacterium]
MSDQLVQAAAINQIIFPDLWQQEAVVALREGHDVVVHAPTGAGKTLIFETWAKGGKSNQKAVYTVPTRALANDKLAEWRGKGWDVGIATGDLSENLDAPIVVATLETQKARLLDGEGPDLLVIDEYQMLGDEERGLNYELAIAQAPSKTRLLLLSGSVANPNSVEKWLTRLGRKVVLVRTDERPVPLEEVSVDFLNRQVPSSIKTYWPRFVVKALAEDLGPILIFAPHRRSAESIANELARKLPNPDPLNLTELQQKVVGSKVTEMLKSRVCYHHSGLSYAARAGVIEPLAKAGQLRVVVATMGLASGINFSLRSVALAGTSYRKGSFEHVLRADEVLQMFGRAGRRGIDETGYVLVSANGLRLREAYPGQLNRNGLVDWGALLGVMHSAVERGVAPFAEAVRIQKRLFSTKPVDLGVEFCIEHPDSPCGLNTDAERARRVRKTVKEYLNSKGEWCSSQPLEDVPLRDVMIHRDSLEGVSSANEDRSGEIRVAPGARERKRNVPDWLPLNQNPAAMDGIGQGEWVEHPCVDGEAQWCRRIVIADLLRNNRLLLVKWLRRGMGIKGKHLLLKDWVATVENLLRNYLLSRKTPLIQVEFGKEKVHALIDIQSLPVRAVVDGNGIALRKPPLRDVLAPQCATCRLQDQCLSLKASTGAGLLWKRMKLVDANGAPTLRGRVVSFFSKNQGLAIAAALEKDTYKLEELIYDLANLDAGHRFCEEEARWAGRLALVCQNTYGKARITGYLENGVPPSYGNGAGEIAQFAHKESHSKSEWTHEILGAGDIDRVIIEWRSLLRRIVHAPNLKWPRWEELKSLASSALEGTESPTITELPSLEYRQSRRISHKLNMKRY